MNDKGYVRIPNALCHWITFLTKGLPLRSQSTFVELLIGALLTPTGFVTDAYLAVNMVNHWTSYYKWLQCGRWSWLQLSRRFIQIVLAVVKDPVIHIAIDDTLTLRSSKKAPSCQIHHQHGHKPNLAAYVLGQCWVSLALVTRGGDGQGIALPLLSRLIPSASNTGKLVAGKTLFRAMSGLFYGKTVRVLADSWYMRKTLIASLLAQSFHVIGQVRIDTRLYDKPPVRKKKQRGRPRQYGGKYTPKRIAHLPKQEVMMTLYGKIMRVRLRSKTVLARFLQGLEVKVVWCELFDEKHQRWSATKLLLSTDARLTAEEVVSSYALRWNIESLFHQLKQAWGLKEAWQQTRQTLHRWVHVTMFGFGLVQLLNVVRGSDVVTLCCHSPWRKETSVTAGLIRTGLQTLFRQVNVRSLWDRKRQKFGPIKGIEQLNFEKTLPIAA